MHSVGHRDLSFKHPEEWPSIAPALKETHLSEVAAGTIPLLIGDDRVGPLLVLSALPPDMPTPRSPAHGHASDNWRVALLGSIEMGKESYGPGQFRCQEGWKPYASDTVAHGPRGGWGFIVMGDRRGTRARTVQDPPPGWNEAHLALSELFGFGGDLVDPADTAGPSALATTLGQVSKGGKLNGSFADANSWRPVPPATRVAGLLLGDPDVGPVIILAATDPGACAASESTFGTEVVRIVVAGDCTIGDARYEMGDARVEEAGSTCPAVVAGDDGLQEILVLGDRRHAVPRIEGQDGWPAVMAGLLAEILGELDGRELSSANA